MLLGTVAYSHDQCVTIINNVDSTNGMITLGRELIAAKLNEANGAGHDCIDATVTESDNRIGNMVMPPFGNGFIQPALVQNLVLDLTKYNKGQLCCAEHCNP